MKTNLPLTKTIASVLLVVTFLGISPTLFAQVKIGTNPTVIGSTSNLEVEAANNKKVTVNKTDGTVVLENVPTGTGEEKPMTIDVSGNVRQGSFPIQAVPQTIWVGQITTDYAAPLVGINDYVTLPTRIPFTPSANSLPGWDAANKYYVIGASGYYRVFAGAFVEGSAPSPQNSQAYLRLVTPNGGSIETIFSGVSNDIGRLSYSSSYEGYYNAGDKIWLSLQFFGTSGQTSLKAMANKTFLSITKIPL